MFCNCEVKKLEKQLSVENIDEKVDDEFTESYLGSFGSPVQ